jgi:hypothetical protein
VVSAAELPLSFGLKRNCMARLKDDPIIGWPVFVFDARQANALTSDVEAGRFFEYSKQRRLPFEGCLFEFRHCEEVGYPAGVTRVVVPYHHPTLPPGHVFVAGYRHRDGEWLIDAVRTRIDLEAGRIVGMDLSAYDLAQPAPDPAAMERIAQQQGGFLHLGLRLLEASPSSERQHLPNHARPLALRSKRDATWDYRIVKVTAEVKPRAEPQGGHHASPRLHLRRGHWRHLRSGREVWVRDCKVGDKTQGGVIHDYVVERGTVH